MKLQTEMLAECKRTLPAGDSAIIGTIYDTACVHALMIAKADDKTKQADVAMDWLKQAVAAGYRNAANVKTDKRLDALRERADFRALLGELEVGKKIDQQ